jgi:hypothetical protein
MELLDLIGKLLLTDTDRMMLASLTALIHVTTTVRGGCAVQRDQ